MGHILRTRDGLHVDRHALHRAVVNRLIKNATALTKQITMEAAPAMVSAGIIGYISVTSLRHVSR
jgi:hypothetical protein